jgi:hypothetical protein
MHGCSLQGDVIILEEAAYCDPGLVSEVYAAHLKPCEHSLKVNDAIQCGAAPVNATIRALVHFDDFGLW